MKKIVCSVISIFCVSAVFAQTQQLLNYKQVMQAVKNGGTLSAVIEVDKCKMLPSSVKGVYDGAVIKFNLDSILSYKVIDAGQERYAIAGSNTALTDHRDFGPVYVFGRLRLFEDNSAEFHSAYYLPTTYEKKASVDFVCRLSSADDGAGLKVFNSNA